MQEAIIKFHEPRSSIHARSVRGRFRRYKTAIMLVAFSVYFGLPWLPWERAFGPAQAVLFDLAERKFYLFGLTVQPENSIWLMGFLVIAALLLFFITGLSGRVFCGNFCFQTIWTDLFVHIEKWVQGDQLARHKLDQQAWTLEKLVKKTTTWALYLLAGLCTGLSFTLYWGEAGALLTEFFTGTAPVAMYVTTLILTVSTVLMAGFAREMVCLHMCPYARFQSAMVDKGTRVIAYDQQRGERTLGRHKAGTGLKLPSQRVEAGIGDCVDCNYCVQVCPTGVDIREGLQIGCIQCGLCIDACDSIMTRLNWNTGLIRYRSEKENARVSVKTLMYGSALAIATAGLIYSILTTAPVEVSLTQIRKPLYVELSDDRIQNSYELKLKNLTDKTQTWMLSLEGLPKAELSTGHSSRIVVPPLRDMTVHMNIKRPLIQEQSQSSVDAFNFLLTPEDRDEQQESMRVKAGFYSPGFE